MGRSRFNHLDIATVFPQKQTAKQPRSRISIRGAVRLFGGHPFNSYYFGGGAGSVQDAFALLVPVISMRP